MKNFSFGATVLALLFCACEPQEEAYTITADLQAIMDNGIEVDSIVLSDSEGTRLQKADKIDKEFRMSGTINQSQLAKFTVYLKYAGESTNSDLSLVLEPGDIVFDAEIGVFKGTPLNDAIQEFQKQVYEALEADEDPEPLYRDFVAAHKDDASCPVVLGEDVVNFLDAGVVEDLWQSCSEQNQKTAPMQALKNKIDKLSKTSAGKMFTDFEATYNGKVQRLSDYVGKGKYVLVDFWASWCGPCRREVPNIIEVYNKYKGERFEVLGVATWDRPEDTLKAIEEEGITYPQILNAQKAGSDAYSIEGIPEIILFAPDGTIVKRGLRGNQIEAAVKEVLE